MAVLAAASRTKSQPLNLVWQYLAEIGAIPGLSVEQERRLVAAVAAGNRDALRSLVENHLTLVVGIARRYAGQGVPLEDLIQEGNLGLLHAAEKFDPGRGVRFATYATWWVRQRIFRAVSRLARTIRVPPSVLRDMRRLAMAAMTLERRLGHQPTDAELAAAIGRPLSRIAFLRSIPQDPISFADPRGEGGRTLEPSVPVLAEPIDVPTETLQQALARLAPRLQVIIRLRYGLGEEHRRSLREVGTQLHISRERVRQLEQEALKGMREHWVA